MKKNVGMIDRIFRLLLSASLFGWAFYRMEFDVLGTIAVLVALILVLTSIFSFCPIYRIFRTSSIFKKRRA